MAEIERFSFSHKEVVEALIKKQDLHEGLWSLTFEFGIGAAYAGPDSASLNPTALVPVLKVGLQRATEKTNLTADAAEINPEKPQKKTA
jgi:hypothetical protein